MTVRARARQHAAPIFIANLDEIDSAQVLDREPFAADGYDESFLQTLIHRFPEILPVSEIEPAFGTLLPVCREMQTPVGRIDNLFVTERGNLAIVECKLWKNPEARRQVVAQIVEYAQSIADWTYEKLEEAIRAADGQKQNLFSYVSSNSDDIDLNETDFIDAVSRNLRLGRVLLLIVGEGIREGIDSLTEYLQKHAGFHFTLSVVEMAVHRHPSQGFFVQPRILARTVHIERGIVRLNDSRISVESAPTESFGPRGISEEQLREQLQKDAATVASALNAFEARAKDLGVFIDAARASLHVRWQGPDGIDYSLGGITPKGQLRTNSVTFKPYLLGRVDLAHEYLARIATLMGKSVHQSAKPKGWRVDGDETNLPDAIDLLSQPEKWLDVIRWYTAELTKAIEAKDDAE
jgi:hypothetical protein